MKRQDEGNFWKFCSILHLLERMFNLSERQKSSSLCKLEVIVNYLSRTKNELVSSSGLCPEEPESPK